MTTAEPPKKRKRRSPEERAEDLRRKLQKARVEAAQQARKRETMAKLLLADALVETVTARELHFRGSQDSPAAYNLAFLHQAIGNRLDEGAWQVISSWWKAKGYPET